MNSTSDPSYTPALHFRFQDVDDLGREAGMRSRPGHFDGQTLWLDAAMLPIEQIRKTQRRHDRLIVHLEPDSPAGLMVGSLAFSVRAGAIDALHSSLNEIVSARRAAERRRSMRDRGDSTIFCSTECPHCRSTLDLTGFDETPQIYCDFCDTVYVADGSGPDDEVAFSLCDRSRLYARSRVFVESFVPWRRRRVHACNAAFAPTALRMLLCSLPLVVGVPIAVHQLGRVMLGGETRSRAFRGLRRANADALSGRTDRAIAGYRTLAETLGPAAGVRYNEGLAAAKAEYFAEAVLAFEAALEDCANYRPAAELLALSLQRLGDHAGLADLAARWHGEPVPATQGFDLRLADAA